jgi:hypothetical protein
MTSKIVRECAGMHYESVLKALNAMEKGEEIYDGSKTSDRIRYNLRQLYLIASEGRVTKR